MNRDSAARVHLGLGSVGPALPVTFLSPKPALWHRPAPLSYPRKELCGKSDLLAKDLLLQAPVSSAPVSPALPQLVVR